MEKSCHLHGPSQVEVHYRSRCRTYPSGYHFLRRRYLVLMFAALIPFHLFVFLLLEGLVAYCCVRKRLSKTFHIVEG